MLFCFKDFCESCWDRWHSIKGTLKNHLKTQIAKEHRNIEKSTMEYSENLVRNL
jgi:hypothetical protein